MELFERINKELNLNYKSDERINWKWIVMHKKLSENFIREFKNYFHNWTGICRYQSLSEDFIKEFSNRIDWECISKHQALSDGFIEEFKDKLSWCSISKYQSLSENFIRRFKDRINFICISECHDLSNEFISEFDLDINSNFNFMTHNEVINRLSKRYDEFYEDYFIAYISSIVKTYQKLIYPKDSTARMIKCKVHYNDLVTERFAKKVYPVIDKNNLDKVDKSLFVNSLIKLYSIK